MSSPLSDYSREKSVIYRIYISWDICEIAALLHSNTPLSLHKILISLTLSERQGIYMATVKGTYKLRFKRMLLLNSALNKSISTYFFLTPKNSIFFKVAKNKIQDDVNEFHTDISPCYTIIL